MAKCGITPASKIGGRGISSAIGNSRRARDEEPSIAAMRVEPGRIAEGSALPRGQGAAMARRMKGLTDSVAYLPAPHETPAIAQR